MASKTNPTGAGKTPRRRSAQTRQVRTAEARVKDEVGSYIIAGALAHLRGEAHEDRPVLGPDMPFEIQLPFGKASYVFSSLTPIGSEGVYAPGRINVDFSRDRSAPIRKLKIEIQQGIPMCTEIHLASRPDGRGLRTADLASIDLANWIEDILSECSWQVTADGFISRPGERQGRDAIKQAQKTGRRKVTPDLLQRVAELYRTHFDNAPIDAISDEFDVSYRTAARYVQECRKDEFQLLPKTHQGKRKA